MIKWLNEKVINWDRVKELLDKSASMNWYTNGGPVSMELESKIRDYLKIDDDKAVIVISNGSHALHAIVAAIELKDGAKKYAVPAYTFPTNIQGNLDDAFIVDINDDFGIDLDLVESFINDSDRIDGIVVTNIFGYAQDIGSYERWAKQNNKILIFDNAATSLTLHNGSNCLNYGNASIVSFHHTKPLGFGEGGAIIIDKQYESYVRRVINFGFDENREPHRVGNNWKMSDIAASFILQHLDKYEDIRDHHIDLYKHFFERIQYVDGVEPFPNHTSMSKSFVSGLAVVFDKPVTVEEAKALCDGKIDIKKYYNPLSARENCPRAHDLYDRVLIYPCHTDMSETDVHDIVENIKQLCNE